jgi:hypothetical protein
MPRAKDIFEEWKVAHRSATLAENAILKQSFAYLDGKGDPPDPAERERAQRLRGTATDLLSVAMERMAAEMKRQAPRGKPPAEAGQR